MSSSEDDNLKKCEFCPIVFSNIDDLANHLVYGHVDNFKIEPENYEERPMQKTRSKKINIIINVNIVVSHFLGQII